MTGPRPRGLIKGPSRIGPWSSGATPVSGRNPRELGWRNRGTHVLYPGHGPWATGGRGGAGWELDLPTCPAEHPAGWELSGLHRNPRVPPWVWRRGSTPTLAHRRGTRAKEGIGPGGWGGGRPPSHLVQAGQPSPRCLNVPRLILGVKPSRSAPVIRASYSPTVRLRGLRAGPRLPSPAADPRGRRA